MFLGIVACALGLYFVPVVNQHRETSMISVSPNGGNTEFLHVNVPTDRIMIGAPEQTNPLPIGLEWPSNEIFSNVRAELFKIRDAKDVVVGVASRMAASGSEAGDIIEWVLHLPARGSVYASMQATPANGGYRVGEMLAGTREFATLHGRVTERWVADTSGSEDAPAGRIELQTLFVADQGEL